MTSWMSLVAITMIANAAPTPFARQVPPQNPIRVRLAHGSSFSLTGVNVVLNNRAYPGLRTFIVREGRAEGAALDTIAGENLRVNLKPAPSNLEIKGHNLIATLDLETYLRGVLPAEMPASWPLEALKAQAVAARTFALYRRAHAGEKDFDVDSDVNDQMFLSDTSKAADRAIDETRGLVLRDTRGALVAAYFHSDCGGHTEDAHNVWGTGDSVGTAGCPYASPALWSLKLSLEQLGHKLRQKISRIEVGKRNESGRIQQVYLALADGTGKTLTGSDFRAALGFSELKSTAFEMARAGDGYIFTGHGYGHGVGLCQWGARQMAKAGQGFREILAHYYPKAGIEPGGGLDRHPDLNDEEGDGANNKQAAEFHKKSLPRL